MQKGLKKVMPVAKSGPEIKAKTTEDFVLVSFSPSIGVLSVEKYYS